MCSLKTKTSFHQADDLVKVAVALVERQQSGKLLGVDLECQHRTMRSEREDAQ